MILPASRGRGPLPGRCREGKVLVMFALLLPVLLGVVGLVIDGGLLMVAQRQAQNAADAAAMAAAMDLFRGNSAATATTTANTFLTNNGLSGITLTLNAGTTNALNNPPKLSTSPFFGNIQYAEVYVTKPVITTFIQVLGVNQNQQVSARAVAGYEAVGAGEGVFVLDPTAAPGLSINTNNTRLVVNGDITVNSLGGGVDQFGNTVSTSLNSDAVKVSNSTTTPAPIVATTLNVSGGVTNLDNIRAYDPAFGPTNYYDPNNTDRPVLARVPNAPDPLATLETPSTSPSAGTAVINRNLGSPAITNNGQNGLVAPNVYNSATNTTTLYPGIYSGISMTGGTVALQPGIYVLASNATNTLSVSGGTLTGSGVMFYNTASSYNPSDGTPDKNDGSSSPAKNNGIGGAFQINGGTINLTPLADNGPFNGLLFYQRRLNTNAATISGSSSSLNFQGTLYAKWAQFKLSGQGSYQAQFLVGSMAIDGGATVTINATGKKLGRANLVFLVE